MATYPAGIYSHTTVVDGSDYPRATHINTPGGEIVAIETELGTNPRGSATDVKTRLSKSLDNAGFLDFTTSTELTISSGAVTVTQNWHTIDTQADAASDDLDTLTASGVTDGFLLFIRANNAARTVVVKHNTGNIVTTTASDLTLDETYKVVSLIYDATLSKWIASMPASSAVAGSSVQAVHTQSGAKVSGTTIVPSDDTIPQNTEGVEIITLAVTPTSATNKLVIECLLEVSYSVAATIIAALFQDTTAGALSAGQIQITASNQRGQVRVYHEMVAGTTSETTFKIRAGGHTAGTITINGAADARELGGVLISYLRVTEIAV